MIITKNIRIALQSKGRLRELSMEYLDAKGLNFTEFVDLISIRDDDIPAYVSSGIADYGIVGENVYYENPSGAKVVEKLDFGFCKLVIAVPKDFEFESIDQLKGKRIATSYPNLLKAYLNKFNIKADILIVQGSTEVAPALGFSDFVCDLVQSGRTLEDNNLKPILTIMNSQAILVESPVQQNFINNPLIK